MLAISSPFLSEVSLWLPRVSVVSHKVLSIPFHQSSQWVPPVVSHNLFLKSSGTRAGFRQWRSDVCDASLLERIKCVQESCTWQLWGRYVLLRAFLIYHNHIRSMPVLGKSINPWTIFGIYQAGRLQLYAQHKGLAGVAGNSAIFAVGKLLLYVHENQSFSVRTLAH